MAVRDTAIQQKSKHFNAALGAKSAHALTGNAAGFIRAGDDLARFPFRGRTVPNSEMREITLVRPYIIRYRIEGERVIILGVRHGSRRR
jgi:plasmid stabilization system protein ParE